MAFQTFLLPWKFRNGPLVLHFPLPFPFSFQDNLIHFYTILPAFHFGFLSSPLNTIEIWLLVFITKKYHLLDKGIILCFPSLFCFLEQIYVP